MVFHEKPKIFSHLKYRLWLQNIQLKDLRRDKDFLFLLQSEKREVLDSLSGSRCILEAVML